MIYNNVTSFIVFLIVHFSVYHRQQCLQVWTPEAWADGAEQWDEAAWDCGEPGLRRNGSDSVRSRLFDWILLRQCETTSKVKWLLFPCFRLHTVLLVYDEFLLHAEEISWRRGCRGECVWYRMWRPGQQRTQTSPSLHSTCRWHSLSCSRWRNQIRHPSQQQYPGQ